MTFHPTPLHYKGPDKLRGFLAFALVGFALAAVVCYGVFQARKLIAGPSFTVAFMNSSGEKFFEGDVGNNSNHEMAVETDDPYMELTGITENTSELYVNGEQALRERDGSFTFPLILRDGSSIINIRAVGKGGRKEELLLGVYLPPTT